MISGLYECLPAQTHVINLWNKWRLQLRAKAQQLSRARRDGKSIISWVGGCTRSASNRTGDGTGRAEAGRDGPSGENSGRGVAGQTLMLGPSNSSPKPGTP